MVMMKKPVSIKVDPLSVEKLTKANSYQKILHPRLDYWFALIWLDLNNIFVRDQWVNPDRYGNTYDYGVYLAIDTSKNDIVSLPYMPFLLKGRLVYVGRGVINLNKMQLARGISHELSDALSQTIANNKDICIYFFGWGMTYDESAALEAFWIRKSGLKLSKFKQKSWDGEHLLNKKYEKHAEAIALQILKSYGDNIRPTI